MEINDSFPKEHLYFINEGGKIEIPWFVNFANNLAARVLPKDIDLNHKKTFFADVMNYLYEDPR